MNKIDKLVQKYEEFCALPWDNVAAAQRTWFIIYPPELERKLRLRYELFEIATKRLKRNWMQIDLTYQCAEWIAGLDYRDRYFKRPQHLEPKLKDLHSRIIETVNVALTNYQINDNTVVALSGIGSLFGFMRVSDLIQRVAPNITGRLLIFFPGEYENNNYRLLDGQGGWNYLAVPITI